MSIFIGMHTIRLQKGNRLRVPVEFCRSLRDVLLDEEKRLFFVRRENKITLEAARPVAEPETAEAIMDKHGILPVPATVMKWLGANNGDHIVLVGAIDTIEVLTARQWNSIVKNETPISATLDETLDSR